LKTDSLRSRQFERILLIKPSAFGDVLHALPVLVKLRARYPAARIDWLITPENAELVRYHPAVSNVVLFARRLPPSPSSDAGGGKGWGRLLAAGAGLLRLVSALRAAHYDLVIDLHGQFRSALFALASGAPVRIGFDRPRRTGETANRRIGESAIRQPLIRRFAVSPIPRFGVRWRHGWRGSREGSWLAYTHRIPIPTLDVHAVDRYLWLGSLLGFDNLPADLRVYWPTEVEERADTLLRQHGLRSFAILAPGTVWQTKHWLEAGFAAVGRFLLQQGLNVVLAGSPQDRGHCQGIAAACPGACDLSGQTTLAELAALMNRSTINVTNDSGSMHLAVALGRPVVSVFGPTNPTWVGPYRRPEAVVRADLPCSPCYFRKLSQCPYDHACMKQISAEEVIERVRVVLGKTAANWTLAG
jgi:lipopolysaccharide heptosyltransferase II